MDADLPNQRAAANGGLPGEPSPPGRPLAAPAELLAPSDPAPVSKGPPVQTALIVLGVVAFLYFGRPFVLPIFLARVGGMTLKPLIRWSSECHIPPALSAAVVLSLLVAGVTIGFIQLGHPALAWMKEGPQHLTELRQKAQKFFPGVMRFSRAAAAVNDLGAADEARKAPAEVELKTSRVPTFINWTGTFLAGVGESLVLLYLVLASGDLFLQKLVRVMPTLRDKKRAVDARMVFAAPPSGIQLHYPGHAGTTLYAEPGRHFRVANLLDLALGRARRFVIGAHPGFSQSHLRACRVHVARQRTPDRRVKQHLR